MRDGLNGPVRAATRELYGDQVTGAGPMLLVRGHRKATELLMSSTRFSTRTRWPLAVPLLTVVSYFARPDSDGSLGSTAAPSGWRFFGRETAAFRRLVPLPGRGFTGHPSLELPFSNADPCSPSGGPDRRGSSAGALGDVRLRRALSTPPAIEGYLVRQPGPNTLSKPQDGSGAATSGVWTVAASWSRSETARWAGVRSKSSPSSRFSRCLSVFQARSRRPASSSCRVPCSLPCFMRAPNHRHHRRAQIGRYQASPRPPMI
jgi:hypothetical protein